MANTLFKNVRVLLDGTLRLTSCGLSPDSVLFGDSFDDSAFDSVIDGHADLCLFPGLADVHVHLREPGFSYKETIKTGTEAAARGGYTAVCTMPNLNPPPDSPAHLAIQEEIIRRDAKIPVYPYGAITVGQKGSGQLVDMAALADRVIAFSDDGKGVQAEETMRAAMTVAAGIDKKIVAHCEDEALMVGKHIHDGAYAKKLGIRGITSESEWKQVERDIQLVRETGCSYHICHISTKESVALLRQAKKEGLPVTGETAPHYLVLTEDDLIDEGRFKMNPPLRTKEDRAALIEGLKDNTIDIIATDHAPHSAEEKSKGLLGSMMGVTGLECAFPVLYTELVTKGVLTIAQLLDKLSYNPRRIFRIPGGQRDFFLFDPHAAYELNPAAFASMGKATPFAGRMVQGKVLATYLNGGIIWNSIEN